MNKIYFLLPLTLFVIFYSYYVYSNMEKLVEKNIREKLKDAKGRKRE